MTDDDHTTPAEPEWPGVNEELTAGREGSMAAVQLLLLLHSNPGGLPVSVLMYLTNLQHGTITTALVGLKARHRVRAIGRGNVARWVLAQFAPRDEPAAAEQGSAEAEQQAPHP